jgi:diguanylate cyclase (GGDEF)-like protein
MPKHIRPSTGLNDAEFEHALLMDRVEAARRFLPRSGMYAAIGLAVFGFYDYITDPRHFLAAWQWRGLGVLILLCVVWFSRQRWRLGFTAFSVLMAVPPAVLVWALVLVATEVDTGLLRYSGSIALMLTLSGAWFFRKRTFFSFQLLSLIGIWLLSRRYSGAITQQVLQVTCLVGSLCGALFYDLLYRLSRRALRLQLELHTESRTDMLTALPNRRAFMERAQHQMMRNKSKQKPFSVLLIDADHFKQINDHYGHDVGDRTLQTLASIVANSLGGPTDCGRLGGEEFAVMLDRDTQQALEFAQALVLQVAQFDWQLETLPSMQISIGVASLAEPDQSLTDLLKRADHALYAAKNAGRNRASLAEQATRQTSLAEQATRQTSLAEQATRKTTLPPNA